MTYTEFLIDSLFAIGEEPKPPWMDSARSNVMLVIEACWAKIQMPPHKVILTWDSDERASFRSFRADVEDLLQSSYTLLGLEIFGKFAEIALHSLRNRAWLHLEATLFCLNALSSAIADEDSVDNILSQLFGSSLFAGGCPSRDMFRISITVESQGGNSLSKLGLQILSYHGERNADPENHHRYDQCR